MKPATIALVSHQVVGHGDGQGRVNYEIARAALKDGVHLYLLAMRCDEHLAADPAVEFVELNHESMPTQILRNATFVRSADRWLRAHRKDYDLIHATGYVTSVPADVNTAHFVHGGWLKSPAYPYSWMGGVYSAYQRLYTVRNAHLEKIAFSRASRTVAVSQKIADELRDIGVPEERLEIIYNGIDVQEFYPSVGDRARFGLPAEGVVFLFAGDIRTTRKGLDVVLNALLDMPAAHLAVAGAREGSPFPQQVAALGLQDRVHFLGKVTDMPALMRAVDIFVFPSRYEAMSLVVLEALASGLPVLTARAAGSAEIVGHGGRVLDNPNDAATLAHWMRELAGNKALRQQMGAAGRKIATEYTWKRMAEDYLALYSSLLPKKSLCKEVTQ